jgi:ATP-dependent Zn protease
MRNHLKTAVSLLAGLLSPALSFASDNNPDPMGFLITFLETWGPFLIFIIVWFFVMRWMRFNQPWDQITKRLEGIENQLGRIANILERRDK